MIAASTIVPGVLALHPHAKARETSAGNFPSFPKQDAEDVRDLAHRWLRRLNK